MPLRSAHTLAFFGSEQGFGNGIQTTPGSRFPIREVQSPQQQLFEVLRYSVGIMSTPCVILGVSKCSGSASCNTLELMFPCMLLS